MRARWCDPGTGQFLSQDPLVLLTQQPYAYVSDNPLNYIDPSGLYEGEGTGGIIELGANAAPEPNGVPSEGGGASGAGSTDTCPSGLNISGANYAQRTYSPRFGPGGPENIAGRLITEVVNDLKSGALTPQDLPVDVIEREGNTLILNTRTSQALTQAGIPRELWYVIDQTGNPDFERMLSAQLSRNGLDSTGIASVLPK